VMDKLVTFVEATHGPRATADDVTPHPRGSRVRFAHGGRGHWVVCARRAARVGLRFRGFEVKESQLSIA
jgi:hypothetical protein